ncbi:MAG: acireductone synthase [Cyanobacteria bacterium]|nr:acireductone synthase [Cyanobacteria bacterium bin.51]
MSSISHVLLDIEGTTCPVSFVAATLFPYARARLQPFLQSHGQDPDLQPLLSDLNAAWRSADHETEKQQSKDPSQHPSLDQLCIFLQQLIDADRKLTALKDLQGLIWNEGYADGQLRTPLFNDVPPTLKRWHADGLHLAVYSSGSVAAQQLLYAHSNAGDLRPLFSAWFDTRSGPKQDPASYLQIANSLAVSAARILFVSDSLAELDAAQASGLATCFSRRAGNPDQNPGSHNLINSLEEIQFTG